MTIVLYILATILIASLIAYFTIRVYSLGALHAIATYAADNELDEIKLEKLSRNIAHELETHLKNGDMNKENVGKNPPF